MVINHQPKSLLYKWVIILVGIVIVLTMYFAIGWQRFLNTPLTIPNGADTVTVVQGSSLRALAQQLAKQKIIEHPLLFELLVRLKGNSKHIQAGEYQLIAGTTPVEFIQQLVSGKVILRELTIVDGWTFAQMMQAVVANPYLKHTIRDQSASSIMQLLGHAGQNPEGHFYPNTYLFAAGTSDVEVLQKAYQRMQSILQQQWQQRAKNLPYQSAYQALIMASLIQKETALDSERAKIAGVLVRRLKLGMRLQVDPTVIYALGKHYNGQLTRNDMRVKSAYNTYLHYGLPPTPIALPTQDSIYAALHPQLGKALYYVAKPDGSHEFSDTLKTHDAAIREYLLKPAGKK